MIRWEYLYKYVARIAPMNCGAKCIHESTRLIFPEKTKALDTAGLNEARDISPTVIAPTSTTRAIAAP